MSILTQFKLLGKTALVTGCDKGIGQAMAIALAEAGADVVGTSRYLDLQTGETHKAITHFDKKSPGNPIYICEKTNLFKFIFSSMILINRMNLRCMMRVIVILKIFACPI